MKPFKRLFFGAGWITVIVLGMFVFSRHFTAPVHAAGTWYVSKNGTNADGRTWNTAWNELSQINWSAVQPGDTILIDGGSTRCLPPNPNIAIGQNHVKDRPDLYDPNHPCGMRYTSTLEIGKSGTASLPITIRVSEDTGRNGTAVIFGGRVSFLPECGSGASPSLNDNVRTSGINFNGFSNIVIDGRKWSGIIIYGHASNGIALGGSGHLIRNVEIFDNGLILSNGDPDQKGVALDGSNIRFERMLIHDNGQDAMQGGNVSNLTVFESWLYNSREHSTDLNHTFNSCRHTDGIQLYGGDASYSSGITVERSVFGPGFMQNLLLGEALGSDDSQGTTDNVTLRNSVFIKATTTSISTHDPDLKPKNWTLQNITSYRNYVPGLTACSADDGHTVLKEEWNNLYVTDGATGFNVTNSIFYGGCQMYGKAASFTTATNNCQAGMKTGYLPATSGSQGIVENPMFTRISSEARLAPHLNDDYSLQSGSPCAGKGSSVTSAAQLLALGETPIPTLTGSAVSPTVTLIPSPSTAYTPTPTPLISLTMQAEEGTITAPFTIKGTYISQSIETVDPAAAGRAVYPFKVPKAGRYIVVMKLNAPSTSSNSLFVNIDGEPVSPTAIWDIPVTSGFEDRVVSWRGNGTVDANQFVPMVFELAAGNHTLVLLGREKDVQIDSIQVNLAPLCAKRGDLDCDGLVNVSDLGLAITNYGSPNASYDINQDGIVNSDEAVIILKNWGI